MDKRRVNLVLGIGLILILIIQVSAISQADYKDFLRKEMGNYFQAKPNSITKSELEKAIVFYFDQPTWRSEIDLSESGLSEDSIKVILGKTEATGGEKESKDVEENSKIQCCTKIDGSKECKNTQWTECSANPSCEGFSHDCDEWGIFGKIVKALVLKSPPVDCNDYKWERDGYHIEGYPKISSC